MTLLHGMPPAQYQAWQLLFRLAELRVRWVLIGGQMTALLAAEHGVTLPRATLDADVLVDVRASPGAVGQLSAWLIGDGLELEGVSPANVGHRFSRPAHPGPGTVTFDVLAPEGLKESTDTRTVPPARTVQVPASGALIHGAQTVTVTAVDLTGHATSGRVHRPTELGALIGKSAATSIPVRSNRDRDWQDAALLASILPQPRIDASQLTPSERKHLRRLTPLRDAEHPAWRTLPSEQRRRGRAAVSLLLDAVG